MQLLAQATTRRITIDGLSPHFLLLTITWRTPLWGTDKALLWRLKGRAPLWTDEEIELIQKHYPTMPQQEMLRLLPIRSWRSIGEKAYKLGIARTVSLPEKYPGILSMQDMAVMQEYGICCEEITSDNQTIWLSPVTPQKRATSPSEKVRRKVKVCPTCIESKASRNCCLNSGVASGIRSIS